MYVPVNVKNLDKGTVSRLPPVSFYRVPAPPGVFLPVGLKLDLFDSVI